MSLDRLRPFTAATLLAWRANALQSIKPRTARGKAGVGLSALKLALDGARSARLRNHPICAGHDHQPARSEAECGQIRSSIAQASGTSAPGCAELRTEQKRGCDGLATEVWRLALDNPGGLVIDNPLRCTSAARWNKAEEFQKAN